MSQNILKILASKCMPNFTPCLSCVVTLLENKYISKRIGTLFSSAWMHTLYGMMQPTDDDEFQYSLKFQVLTVVSVMHLPDWTLTGSHSLHHVQFMVLHYLDSDRLNQCLKFFAACKYFTRTRSYFEIPSVTSVQCIL